ncbi:protein tyrosine phosphatase-like domain-containing protein [Aspergillus clavatus NRRL 1]|uniref:Very-long-chain (3R)-3-hydroxyacyl-CoA dehydratase n=1 Tax=Aspergillus clavatus (strain ATCC 1007 / CBS 513.65 / DSM 816 / NCTC 3887 / NRRL 1 / QM 1276 / 107) TaxID=344612 RepID=A1CHX1_ASPCL|nr:phosphatase-like protein (PTPLA), putative [Aspergillus clavatus NRRL 1]EAW10476.1 phosphatase-like protein (PTPLA), putative [Aspergillus clavatus NRRL 1]
MSTTTSSTAPRPSASNLTRLYLLAYNTISFGLWAICTVRGAMLALSFAPSGHLPAVFHHVYSPLLTTTQSLAFLEVLHSLLGIVRAPVVTTAMQVASRLLLVWGVMYLFHDRGDGQGGIVGGDFHEALPQGPGAKVGDYAFMGCLSAWGITECIRYGFFALQVWGSGVPSWWTWLRYNTFYVLYPLGISSECVMLLKALKPAAEWHHLYRWFLVANLVIYVPGSYILYTHMIAQRRKVLKKKGRAA